MKRLAFACAALILGSSAGADETALDGHVFTLPSGFTIERVAGPPLVDRPIVADFDEQGRLYVADSSGSNDNVQKQLAERTHRIVRLEDADGDGRFDRQTVFADRFMFPEGAMWHAGSLYVSAPPSIWKLTDTDGDGVADRREEWFRGKTLTGCANDLHGPYLGPDGWIYWCKGAFAEQTYERAGKAPLVTRAAHILRRRADGTGPVEPVMTGGMDNPVEVAFSPGGERFFTTTFLQHPGGGNRDGVIHAIYGGVYGKDHDVIEGHPRTGGALMPVLAHLGPAAPSGLTRYESGALGPEFRDNLLASLFNMQKVVRLALEPDGATFRTRAQDLVVSSNKDFHPTDVLEDADGSLLVVDTGGWYKLCCPTSQLGKPDVLGAIYRVRRRGMPAVDDPRGLKVDWQGIPPAGLARLLDDPRPAVRRRALRDLAAHGGAAVPVLAEAVRKENGSAEARRNAVWAATRIDDAAARPVVRQALDDADESVRQAAIHGTSVRRDREALSALLRLVSGGPAPVRRAAAEALGRLGDRSAVPPLLKAAGEPADQVLEHSLIYALIEIADPSATAEGLKSPNVLTRRAALVALDQMDGGGLDPAQVAPLLGSPDAPLKEAASWIVARHPQWGDALAETLRARLAAADLSDAQRTELAAQLGRFAGAGSIQQLLADGLRDPAARPETRGLILQAMAHAGLKDVPAPWVAALSQTLEAGDPALVPAAVATARALAIPREKAGALPAVLRKIAADESLPAGVRLEALAAVPGGPGTVDPALFAFLAAQLAADRPVVDRLAAADVLSRAKLDPGQLRALTDALKTAGPLEANRLLGAFEGSADDEVGFRLVGALKGSPALAGLRVETLKPRLAGFGAGVQEQALDLYRAFNVDAEAQKAKLDALLAGLARGEVRRGQVVFNSTKAACSTCHAIGYLGGRVGPDLTRIGQVRAERDLLEAIVFPSASFVRSYEPVSVATRDGRVFSGIVRKDAADEVVLATSATEEARIPRADIEEMKPAAASIMPAGLDQQLTAQELADLVAFLKACK